MENKEMDLLIAKEVMGWNYSSAKEYDWFSPTTKLEDAMRVVEKFDSWQVTKMQPQNKYRAIVQANQHCAYSDNASKAICLASLKAKGIEIEK